MSICGCSTKCLATILSVLPFPKVLFLNEPCFHGPPGLFPVWALTPCLVSHFKNRTEIDRIEALAENTEGFESVVLRPLGTRVTALSEVPRTHSHRPGKLVLLRMLRLKWLPFSQQAEVMATTGAHKHTTLRR